MALAEQLKTLLRSSYVREEERKEWLELIPDLTEDELKELISLLNEQQGLSLSLTSRIREAAVTPKGAVLVRLDVEDVPALTFEQLKNPTTLEQLRNLILAIERERDVGRAVDLLRGFQKLLDKFPTLAEEEPKIAEEYGGLVVWLKYLSFPTLTDKDAEELFRNHLRFALESGGFDVKEKVDARFFFYHDEATGGEQHGVILRAVRENEELIGSGKIEVTPEGGPAAPTVKNWLRDYELFFEKSGVRSTVDRVTYVSQNKNARKLGDEEKDFLLKVLGFYDYLMFPSAVTRAMGAPLPKIGGEIEIPPDATAAPPLTPQDIAKLYQGSPAEEEAVEKGAEEISKLIETGKEKIEDVIYESLFQKVPEKAPAKIKVVASLRVAAEEKKLEGLLVDKRFQELMINYFRRKNLPQDVDGFKINPLTPVYFSHFLRYVLRELIGLDENESGRIGMRLVNIMRRKGNKKYTDIVYFDSKRGEFFWK